MILAAGGATRLYPLTHTLPKPMVPVLNIPVIEHLIELLARHGFTDIMVNLHYLHRVISDYLQDGSRWGVRIHYSHEQELMGTAGGVRKVADFFDETFLVIGGDDLTDLNLTEMLAFHREKKAVASIAVSPVLEPTEFGVAEIDEDNRVTWFLEKPRPEQHQQPGGWSNTGVYLFEPAIFEHIPARSVFDFGKQLFPELVRTRSAFFGYPIGKAYWCDVGNHLHYRQAHYELLDGKSKVRIPGKEIRPHVWVEEGAEISPQASVMPPALIGAGVRIEAGAIVEGPVVLGAGTIVEGQARVQGSILWDRCRILKRAEICECLVGSSCVLQAGHRYSKMVVASGSRTGDEERHSQD